MAAKPVTFDANGSLPKADQAATNGGYEIGPVGRTDANANLPDPMQGAVNVNAQQVAD